MRLPLDKALFCLKLLTEGTSIRATVRLSGVAKDTVTALLVCVGEKCEAFLRNKLQQVEAHEVGRAQSGKEPGMSSAEHRFSLAMLKNGVLQFINDHVFSHETFLTLSGIRHARIATDVASSRVRDAFAPARCSIQLRVIFPLQLSTRTPPPTCAEEKKD
jgi:hypothetical protein